MKLTTQQARVINQALHPGLNYLTRLRRRMEQVGFEPKDELFQTVCAAQRLFTLTHYASCESGVGRSPNE